MPGKLGTVKVYPKLIVLPLLIVHQSTILLWKKGSAAVVLLRGACYNAQ
jgi:hypothetical protein